MAVTLVLDEELVRTAKEFTGIEEPTELVREALNALIEREALRRLSALGGSMPALKDIPRFRA